MLIWGNEAINLLLPRHSNWDTTSETPKCLAWCLTWLFTFCKDLRYPLYTEPVACSLYQSTKSFVEGCYMDPSTPADLPLTQFSLFIHLTSSNHMILSPLLELLILVCWVGVPLDFLDLLPLLGRLLGSAFLAFFLSRHGAWKQKKKFFQMSHLMSRLRGRGAHVSLEQIIGSYNHFVHTRMGMQGLCLVLT